MLYIAFLRGLNVGGRVVKKEVLQQAFFSLGFQRVATFKQSGNVVFEAGSINLEELKGKIERCLGAVLGYEVPVFLRTIAQLEAIIETSPFREEKGEGSSFLVTLLDTPASLPMPLPTTIPKSTAKVIAAKATEVYSVTHGGGEGALPNPYIEKILKTKATTRNLNVIREIVEKFS